MLHTRGRRSCVCVCVCVTVCARQPVVNRLGVDRATGSCSLVAVHHLPTSPSPRGFFNKSNPIPMTMLYARLFIASPLHSQ